MSGTAAQYRSFTFGVTRGVHTQRGDNTYLRAEQPLAPYPERLTDRLQHWAQTAPERTWMARRDASGAWQKISYGEAWEQAQRIGQALLDRGLCLERPVAILSENSLEHALLAVGAMTVGVPYCSVSPAYSLMSQDFEKLRHVLGTITPGLVYASDWARYGKAIEAAVRADVEVAVNTPPVRTEPVEVLAKTSTGSVRTGVVALTQLLKTNITPAVASAMHATGSDTVVKFLFTSGSTKLPKGVINTQRMICANQQQMAQSMPALADEPPVLVDWLPWNHTFGGNHNFGLTIYHGGTLYIDDGKPVPALIGETLRNLREVAPTAYFNVPTGFEQIAHAMKTDDADGRQLRKNLLGRCRMFFYAGAALAQPIWDSLFEAQEREIGERIVMGTGLGMTESAPFGLFVTSPNVKAGDLGLPTPGLELKLVPSGDKLEVRYRGPNITPGYWRNEAATKESFDEEGFFCTGDAVKWIAEDDIHQGLRFDGRIAEDFKLATGTFVSVGPLRAKIIAAGAPLIQDVVITGLNEKEVGALIILALGPARKFAGLPDTVAMKDVATNASILPAIAQIVTQLATNATGSASRIARALVLEQPPSIDKGEITDKGSINQRAVLKERAELVAALYAGTAPNILKP
jgi:feruloyl-CoA synthase